MKHTCKIYKIYHNIQNIQILSHMKMRNRQYILQMCSKSIILSVTMDLLNSENLKVAFIKLSNVLQVCTFTML